MAVTEFYVSIQNGDDKNDGYTANTAKATIQAGINLAGNPGDKVFIGPGTYREYLVGQSNGNINSSIKFIGDPNCLYLTNDKPGYVRVTAAGTDELAVEGSPRYIVDIYSETYNEFYNIIFDGMSNVLLQDGVYYGIYSNSNTNKLYNCSIKSPNYAVRKANVYDCVIFCPYISCYYCNVYDSILVGGLYACYGNTSFSYEAKNNIFFSANYSTYYMKSINNTFVGGGYSDRRGQVENNLYIGCEIGPYECKSTYNGYIDNVLYSGCRYMGRLSNDSLTSQYFDVTYSTNYEDDPITNFTQVPLWFVNYDSFKHHIKRAFDPYFILGLSAVSGTTTNVSNLDIMGRPRQMIDGSEKVNPGAFATSLITETYDNNYYNENPPGYFIEKRGRKIFDVLASTGDITISVQAKLIGSTTGDGAFILLEDTKGEFTDEIDTTVSTSFTELTVTASVENYSRWLKLSIGQEDPAASATFSDIRIY